MTLVFVYGTLKRGGSNHDYLANQNYIGDACTAPGFVLYAVADYPGMVRSADATDTVTGEVWEVDDACLQQLDALEGVDVGLYIRARIALEAPFAAEQVDTFFYLRSIAGFEKIGATWMG